MSSTLPRRLLATVAGAGLTGALSMGTAGAALVDQALSNGLAVSRTVQKCVTVVLPTATATVNATLTVSAAGVTNTTQSSTTVSTGNLGDLTVCVLADAQAQVDLNAAALADLGAGGATVNVGAGVAAQAAVTAHVTANGVQVL